MNEQERARGVTDSQLDELISRLPRSVAPRANLWPGIRRQISSGVKPWRQVAAVAALALGIGLTWSQLPKPASDMASPERYTTTMSSTETVIVTSYEQALSNAIAGASGLTVSAKEWWHTYRSFQQAIKSIRQALDAQPDSPQLLSQLQTTYQQKLQWITATTQFE